MPGWLPRRTVVVPIDFSETAMVALDTALEMVSDPSHLHAIHVLPVLEPAESGIVWQTVDDEARAEHAEAALRKALAGRAPEGVQIAVRFGDPGHEIVRYAEEVDAGLITVSSRGRSGLERLLIGSVADRVVHLAHCPVLVLKH